VPWFDPALLAPDGRWLFAVRLDAPAGRSTAPHRHDHGQLLGALSGLIRVTAGQGNWLAPAAHAVWVPPGHAHGLDSIGGFRGWSVYIAAEHCVGLSQRPGALYVTALLRALVERVSGWPVGPQDEAQQRLAKVLLDEITGLKPAPLSLPMPTSGALQKVVMTFGQSLDDRRTVAEWARLAAMSERSFVRRFARETGHAFGAWRQQCRMHAAIERLGQGLAVKAIARDLGYEDEGAFIAAFKRFAGCTPVEYARRLVAPE